MSSFYVNPGEWCYIYIYIYIYIHMRVCVCVCVCVCVYHLSLSLCVSIVNIAGDFFFFFFFFFNDTCVYAFAECREARYFVSQEVCSHARAGVLAKQCVCFSSSLSDVCPPF